MIIGITGASGPLARATTARLLRLVPLADVVLGTRRPADVPDAAVAGVSVRRLDFADPQTMREAFRGVDRLLLVSIDVLGPDRVRQQRAAVAAAADAGVQHIVYTSLPEPRADNPALVVPDHAATEQAVRESGMTWTMLRNNIYAHLQAAVVAQAGESGRLVTNTGDGAAAYVTREDCATAAAAVLTQSGHEGRVYDVTGPQALSAADLMAEARSRSGRNVEVVQVGDDDYRHGLMAAGLPAETASILASFGAAVRGGYLSAVSTAVADLTGVQPTSLGDAI